jgi:hypothetical protein
LLRVKQVSLHPQHWDSVSISVFPLVYITHDYLIQSPETTLQTMHRMTHIQSPSYFEKVTLLENEPKIQLEKIQNVINEKVIIRSHTSDQITFEASLEKAGLVNFTENYARDWKAKIVGTSEELEVLPANYTLRGHSVTRRNPCCANVL